MASPPLPDVTLDPIQGEPRPLDEWVTTFRLLLVTLDPYTYESSWLIDTAARVLENFRGANCRGAWLVTADADQARGFLGPRADHFLTFTDPDRTTVEALGLTSLPAILHVDHALNVVGVAEGWDPLAWQSVTDTLADEVGWVRAALPGPDDPTPYAGTPARG